MRYFSEELEEIKKITLQQDVSPESLRTLFDQITRDREGERGLMILDMGDEILNSKETYEKFKNICEVVTYEGGSHRFDHIKEAIGIIENYFLLSTVSSSFGIN